VITQDEAERLAHDWIDAFNRHDLEAVLAHYTDGVAFASPAIVEVLGDPSGTLHGKEALRAYFQRGLAKYPNLGFELLQVLTGVGSVTILFRSLHRNRVAAEVMFIDSAGLVEKVTVHYDRALPNP
jgi:hypothetical protein